MNKLLIIFAYIIFSVAGLWAQPPSKHEKEYQDILNKVCDSKKVFGTSYCICSSREYWCGAAGNMKTQDYFFIASTTKLFVTTVILQLEAEGKLHLSDPINVWLDTSVTNRLHVFNGKDYGSQITIQQLLAHTSGLPDYFEDKGKTGKSLEDELLAGHDTYWTPRMAVERSKQIQPLFAPGTPGKAHYSDTNYQLLGWILTLIFDKPLDLIFRQQIIEPLNLKHTYLYTDSTDHKPALFYYKNKPLSIPAAMTSFGADGGMVSTAEDLQLFLQAFFLGKLFPKEKIEGLKQWNAIFSPLESGIGIHRFKIPGWMNPGGKIPELIGHSGLSGTFAYYDERDGVFITGTVNQVAYPSTSFVTAIKLLQEYLRTK